MRLKTDIITAYAKVTIMDRFLINFECIAVIALKAS